MIWTRVTPTPRATPGSGVGDGVEVTWEVALDAGFVDVLRRGVLVTDVERDHTVKVDVEGLQPATGYHYRFLSGPDESPVGRTRTAPAVPPERLRFGVVSCANYQAGYFSAYRHLAHEPDLDAVIHLGDYLYEYGPGVYSHGHDQREVRVHQPAREIVSLADYRVRHGQYKTDPDLQALHAAVPFIVTWDDHEVADGWWREGAFEHQSVTEGSFADRRAGALRAYDEWMPVRLSGTAEPGDGTDIHRRLSFGGLADLVMLDLRSQRDDRVKAEHPATQADERTITGHVQGRWLRDTLAESTARWKLVGNPVMIAPMLMPARPHVEKVAVMATTNPMEWGPVGPNTDTWDGYPADRRRLLHHLAARRVDGVVFLSGDVHTAWANEVPGAAGEPVAAEFVCHSVTSNNVDDFMDSRPRTLSLALEAAIAELNPHVRFVNLDDHGHCVLELTESEARMDWYAISDRTDERATASHLAARRVLAGFSRILPA